MIFALNILTINNNKIVDGHLFLGYAKSRNHIYFESSIGSKILAISFRPYSKEIVPCTIICTYFFETEELRIGLKVFFVVGHCYQAIITTEFTIHEIGCIENKILCLTIGVIIIEQLSTIL